MRSITPTSTGVPGAASEDDSMKPSIVLRQAQRADIPAMHRIRMAVRENILVSTVITPEDYVDALERTGRGWLVEVGEGDDTTVVGFAIGNATTGNIWALFVDPEHEGHGHGRRLHDAMVEWLFAQGLERLWLSTDPGTRAQRFYEVAGWRFTGMVERGEAEYELLDPRSGVPRMG
jgi:GNAT superfamily N-acetyltransferase